MMRRAIYKNRVIANEALQRAFNNSGGGGGSGQEPLIRYVSPNGSDGTGDGSLFKPFLTITHALAVVKALGPTISQFGAVGIYPGSYSENIALLPFINLFSVVPDQGSVVFLGGNISLDPSWNVSTPLCELTSLLFAGNIVLDFAGVAGLTSGLVFFESCTFDNITATGIGSATQIDFNNCFNVSSALQVIFTAILISSQGCTFGPSSLSSGVADTATWNSFIDTISVTTPGDTSTAITVDATAGAAAGFQAIGSQVSGTIHMAGASSTYAAGVAGFGNGVTRTGGAPAPTLFGSAGATAGEVLTSLGASSGIVWSLPSAPNTTYTPAVPGNWAGAAPTTVQQAFDRIAANTTNTHPIP